jgi:hypothetical protein
MGVSEGKGPATYMLVYEQDGDILALRGEAVERCFDLCGFRLGVHDEEVLLRVRGCGYVL